MKAKTLMTIAIAAALLTACDKSNEPDRNYNGEIRLRSGIEVKARAFTPTQGTVIAKGEKISIWVDDAKTPNADVKNEQLYKAKGFTADGANGLTPTNGEMYFPQTGNRVNIFALHGNFSSSFWEGKAFPSDGVEYSVDNRQTSSTYYTQSDLLYASSLGVKLTKEYVSLTFYHILSKIEVAIKMGVGAPKLGYTDPVKLNGVTLNGKFTPSKLVDISKQSERAKMLGAADKPSTGNIILGKNISTDFTDDNIEYNEAVVVPQSMKDKTLTFTLRDGGILTYNFPEDVIFESGKKYQYQITLNLTGLSVIASEITDWVSGGSFNGDAVR